MVSILLTFDCTTHTPFVGEDTRTPHLNLVLCFKDLSCQLGVAPYVNSMLLHRIGPFCRFYMFRMRFLVYRACKYLVLFSIMTAIWIFKEEGPNLESNLPAPTESWVGPCEGVCCMKGKSSYGTTFLEHGLVECNVGQHPDGFKWNPLGTSASGSGAGPGTASWVGLGD